MSLTDSGGPARTYRPDIDGLRAIAITSVVFYHAGVPGIRGGFTGVDIFFAISGYLIGGHIFADVLAGRFSFLGFYRLRARRILPAFFAMLALVLVTGWFLLAPEELVSLSQSSLAATLSASNIYFWRHATYFDTQNQFNPLLMTWSLGIEEQFYAIIPIVLVLFTRIRRSLVLPAILAICVLSFLASWWGVARHPVFVFYLTPMRAWELGAGVTLALVEQGKVPVTRWLFLFQQPMSELVSAIGALSLLAPIFLLHADSIFPGPAALPSVLGAVLLIATPSSWINRRLLSFTPLVFCGRISYSWYLWHWPLLSFLRIATGAHLHTSAAIAAVVISFLGAVASYYLIEQPFRRSRRAPLPLLFRYALLSLVFMAACLFFLKSRGFPGRYPQLDYLESEIDSEQSDPCLLRDLDDTPKASYLCSDAPSVHPVVALWGDSHASALAPALRPLVHQAGYDFFELSKSACRPVKKASSNPDDASCWRFNLNVLRRLQTDPRIRIVLIVDAWSHIFARQPTVESLVAGDHNMDPGLNVGSAPLDPRFSFLHDAIASLQASGRKVVIMEDVPSFEADPVLEVRTSQIPLRRSLARLFGVEVRSQDGVTCAKALSASEAGLDDLRRMAAGLPGLELVDLRHIFCATADRCAYRSQGRMLYLDDQHLSPEGAQFALRDFHLP